MSTYIHGKAANGIGRMGVMVALEASLGTLALTTDHTASLKRAHSLVTRCDSTVVHETAAGTKRALGEATECDVLVPPPRPRRQPSVVIMTE